MQVEGETRLEVMGYRGGKLFTPAVVALCGLHVAGFVVPILSPPGARMWLVETFGLVPDAVFARLHLWHLLTYSCVYPTSCFAWSLVWTLAVFVFFGSRLEREWGTKRLLLFYAVMAAGAGLTRALPEFGGAAIIVGSLGVVSAVLAAFGLAFRGEKVWFWFTAVSVPHFVIALLLVMLLLNLSPIENVLWLSGAAYGVLYTAALFRWDARRVRVRRRAAPSDRFSQIDLGE